MSHQPQRERRGLHQQHGRGFLAFPLRPAATRTKSAEKARRSGPFLGVSDGTRTHDRLDHNQELYQLSYAHRGAAESSNGAVFHGTGLT